MKEIPLTQGEVALVDDEDFASLIKYKWFAVKNKWTIYAYRNNKLSVGRFSTVRMHRQILQPPDGMQVDHINHNGIDNRRCNLRVCTNSENQRNRRINLNNTSGFKGVCWNTVAKKWRAKIWSGDKRLHLGYYFCIIKAAKAYDKAAREIFGDYAETNFKN